MSSKETYIGDVKIFFSPSPNQSTNSKHGELDYSTKESRLHFVIQIDSVFAKEEILVFIAETKIMAMFKGMNIVIKEMKFIKAHFAFMAITV